ncbi:uncharacterized protein LOC114389943 [Glycine soja]|uniref:uncharacterized protein LOC114389943 n=1 Tax=Glycine soja TaxID=3848 RepID=UPI00103C7AD2|nr:uncharacterized protein LOC114389943 [Glycine soja]
MARWLSCFGLALKLLFNSEGLGIHPGVMDGAISIYVVRVNSRKVSATTLNKFSCIALAGVYTEYLIYGFSEGGLDDIRKDLGFAQKKADSQVRWSLLNTVLRRHQAARGKVVEALSTGKSVGSYIDIIENSIDVSDLLLKL